MTEGLGETGPTRRETNEVDPDLALARLEDVLQAVPFGRALPDLQVLLDRAGMPAAQVRRDERVLKVLHEAVLARPFGHVDEVTHTRLEVELLTLEVEVLTDRLADPGTDAEMVDQAVARLAEVRARLDELRDQL